jgi:low molecular weight protein-tyrosine phosphatase
MVAVLFVCMGNICRSPMAEGAFRAAAEKAGLADKVHIDSAGTLGFHAGSAPDQKAQAAARKNGVDISNQQSRKITEDDFEAFDYILVMDNHNFEEVSARCPDAFKSRISMFLSHAPHLPIDEMPDPYGGHRNDFDICYAAAIDAAEGLLAKIKAEHF